MKHLLTVVCVMLHVPLCAQSVWPVGKDPGLGAYSHAFQQVFTTLQHPAALAEQGAFTAGAYMERRFMLKATNACVAALALPVGPGAFGLNVQRLGFGDYHEQELGFGYGRSLGSRVDIGLQADYFEKYIAGYGRAAVTTFNGGLLWKVSPHVCVGMDVFNPVQRRLAKLGEEQLNSLYTLGAGYAGSQFYVSAATTMQSGQPLLTRVLCEYVLVKQFALQAGVATQAQYNFAGVSFRLARLRVELAGSYHPQLGITPGAAVIWKSTEKGQ